MANAEKLGLSSEVGSLEVGKIADFLILDDNPLEDILNTLPIQYTVQGGVIYDADDATRIDLGELQVDLGELQGRLSGEPAANDDEVSYRRPGQTIRGQSIIPEVRVRSFELSSLASSGSYRSTRRKDQPIRRSVRVWVLPCNLTHYPKVSGMAASHASLLSTFRSTASGVQISNGVSIVKSKGSRCGIGASHLGYGRLLSVAIGYGVATGPGQRSSCRYYR